jgi:Tol biopolymer transport system component
MKRAILYIFLISVFLPIGLIAQELPQGKIIFIDIDSKGNQYLCSIKPDGTQKTRLTPAYKNIMFPRYNKKSGWIAFTNKTKKLKSEIYLLNKEGSKIKRILTGAAFEDFSPDGKFILFTSCDGKGELFVYSLERKRAVKISQNFKVTSAAWSPDKNWIAISALEPDGTTDIYLLSTMAMGIKRMTNTKGISESFPVFTSNENYLAFFSTKGRSNYIKYLDIKNSKIQDPIISGQFPSLSPDNKWVVYQQGNTIGISRADGLKKETICPGITPIWIK